MSPKKTIFHFLFFYLMLGRLSIMYFTNFLWLIQDTITLLLYLKITKRPRSFALMGLSLIGESPFGPCNGPTTFQRCMMAIYSNDIEKIMMIFMDDFLIFGTSFANCLYNFELNLQRCEETNLVLN